MKKSNYLVIAIAVLVSAFLLFLWYYLGFNSVDSPTDLVISVVWWVAIVAIVAGIFKLEKSRQQQIRTIYISPAALFNSETGTVELAGASVPAAMQQILEGLEYGFESKDAPTKDEFDYRYVVKTDEFKPSDDDKNEPTWKGAVVKIDREAGNTETAFDGIEQLKAALA